jgi:hypothetical protein
MRQIDWGHRLHRHLVPPESLEPVRRQFGVAHRVLDIPVPAVRETSSASRIQSALASRPASEKPQLAALVARRAREDARADEGVIFLIFAVWRNLTFTRVFRPCWGLLSNAKGGPCLVQMSIGNTLPHACGRRRKPLSPA